MNKKNKLLTIIGIAALVVVLVVAALIGRFAPAADPHAGHNHGNDGQTTTTADPHAGHNHGNDGQTATTADPHAGHNHGGESQAKPTTQHQHDSNTSKLVYTPEKKSDGTYAFTVKNKDGRTLFSKDGLDRYPLVESVNDPVYSIGWPTGTGPNDFQQIYCNRQTGQVSQVFDGPIASDGVRVVLPRALKKSYVVMVQDLFDAKTYSKTYPLPSAYVGGDYTVLGGKLDAETKQVRVSYLVNEKGDHTAVSIPLYPEKE